MESDKIKPVRWVGSSRKDVWSFPAPVRVEVGHALYIAQKGEADPAAKPLKAFEGRRVLEIVTGNRGDTWRSVYSVRFEGAVYVLHAFQEKSKKGIATPKTRNVGSERNSILSGSGWPMRNATTKKG